MTYHNAVKYISDSPQKNGAADSLERISLLCKRLGSPERRLRYIRFAGSNGKTVCQSMLSSILIERNIKVGSLLMPASAEPRENILINGVPISMEDTVKYVKTIADTVTALKAELDDCESVGTDSESESENNNKNKNINSDIPENILTGKISVTPTKNEMIFLVAMLAFRDSECSMSLIECEHNGADPTKVLGVPFSTVICGTIPTKNARETHRIRSYLERGISEVISAPQDTETHNVISSACAAINCRLSVPTRSLLEIKRLSLGGSEFVYRGERYTLPLCGRFQVHNATTVLETVRMLNRSGAGISYECVYRALSRLSIRTKFEVLSVLPTIISDSTHKKEAADTMCRTLEDFKEQTGTRLRLCIQNDTALVSSYVSALSSLGYEIVELILVCEGERSPDTAEYPCPVTVMNSSRAAAKHVTAMSRSDTDSFILMTADSLLAEKLRREVKRILDF